MFNKFKKKKHKEEQLEVIEEQITLSPDEVEVLTKKAENMDVGALRKHHKHYSEDGLWNKIKKYSKKAGSSAIYAVLLLYFVLQKKEVPTRSKAIIIGALGYFILPFDLIPDVAAGFGYTDDIGALLAALWQVSMYIDEDVKNQAKEKLKNWFGDDVDTSESTPNWDNPDVVEAQIRSCSDGGEKFLKQGSKRKPLILTVGIFFIIAALLDIMYQGLVFQLLPNSIQSYLADIF